MKSAPWLLAAALLCSTPAGAEPLGPGDKAPGFALVGSDGRTYRLADYAGKQGVVLAWFPKSFTPG